MRIDPPRRRISAPIIRAEPPDVRKPPNDAVVVGLAAPNIQFLMITRSEPYVPLGHPIPLGPLPRPDGGDDDASDMANLGDS